MKIVIDARFYQQSGIGRYLRNLICKLQLIDRNNEYFVLHLKQDYDTLKYQSNFKKVLADFKWYGITEQQKLPLLLNNIKPDLVHFPHFNVPIFYKGKFVVTIHDLIHQHSIAKKITTLHPILKKIKQVGYRKVFDKALEGSSKILTPTKFVGQQLVGEWNVDLQKIVVTYEAAGEDIVTLSLSFKTHEIKGILEKLGILGEYLLYVGNAHPHKNVEGLIKAFLEIKIDRPNLYLVFAGQESFFWNKVREEYQDKNIIYAGFITDEQLVALYKKATCFVMPSFEEGFGLPILEAMACGCPVIASDIGSLREVGEDACLYFNPHDRKDMSTKILKVLDNKRIAQRLIAGGQKRYKQFSWEKLARGTLSVYQEALKD